MAATSETPGGRGAKGLDAWLLVAVLAAGCAPTDNPPELTGLSPATLRVDELPASVVVGGRGLELSARASLGEGDFVRVLPPVARLDEIRLAAVEVTSGDELRAVVPASFGVGTYDFRVELGPGREASLPRGLTILPAGAGSGDAGLPSTADAASPPDGAVAPDPATADAGAQSDVAPRCGPGEFGAPELVVIEGLDNVSVWSPSLSADHRTLYFAGPGNIGEGVWTATRTDRGNRFGNATRLPTLVASNNWGTPCISADERSLYFYADANGGTGERDLYVATRADTSAPFGSVRELTTLNSNTREHLPWLSPDELTIAFYSWRGAGDGNIWTASRTSKSDDFSAPDPLTELNTSADDGSLAIAPGGLVAYFASDRTGTLGGDDVWYAERAAADAPFSNVRNLSAVNTPANEADVMLSSDAEELFFVVPQSVGTAVYRAQAQCAAPL